MQSTLKEKVFIFLGGTSGIGFEAAKLFLDNDAFLVVVGKGEDETKKARKQLKFGAEVYDLDVTKPATIDYAIETAVKKFGRLDGLYHVAGGSGRNWGDGPLHEISDEGWQKTLDLNLNSIMISNRAVIRYFLEKKKPGSILNMSSVLSFSPASEYFATHAYAASKAAVNGFSQSLASYYAGDNIRINVIAPGLVKTVMSARAQASKKIQKYIKAKQPLGAGGMADPKDLAHTALYFLSDQSKFVTGQVLSVDGGWSVSEAGVMNGK